MDQPTHIIDPDGEVMIILRHENSSPIQLEKGPIPEDEPPPADEPASEDEPASDDEPASEDEPVSEQPVEEFRIQVSARHLTLCSPYFKSRLTGPWKEGTEYLEKGYIEIPVEDCRIEVLLILLRVIHCQYYQVPKDISLEMLAQITSLVDYYDCKEAVDVLAERWINGLDKNIPKSYTQDVILWVWISWYFRLPVEFKQATSTLMTFNTGPIVNLGFPIPKNIIGKRQSAATWQNITNK